MQVTLEKDATGVLGLPYGDEDTPERRFWNLKDSPSLIDQIPEVSNYLELKAFLLEVASPDSNSIEMAKKFRTYGLKQLLKCMEQESIKINNSDTSSLTELLQNI